jgi:hypothetical protein
MIRIEQLGHDEGLGRDLFLLSIPTSQDMPHELFGATARFVCLIAWDARDAGVQELSAIALQLLNAGAVYVCAWGPGCERVHDFIDEERDALDPTTTADSVVMTTWHDDESLADTLGFVLVAAIPDEAYVNDCRSTLGIAIGSAQWAAEIRDAFSRPREWVRQWSAGS